MPYTLIQVSPRLYFVMNIISGKLYSRKPMSYKKAYNQLIALRINTT